MGGPKGKVLQRSRKRILGWLLCAMITLVIVAVGTNLLLSYDGPTFETSTMKLVHINYDRLTVPQGATVTANQILEEYMPKLFSTFWAPSKDVTVTVHMGVWPCKGRDTVGCTSFPSGTHVWINATAWNVENAHVWVHEFTHVLQNAAGGPGNSLQGDAQLFYAEPTAMAMEAILPSFQQGGDICASYYRDTSVAVAGFGSAQAAFNYYMYSVRDDAHAMTRVWLALYRAYPNIFEDLNARLIGVPSRISSIQDFRRVIALTLPVQVLDGRPVDSWLQTEGLMGSDEVGSGPFLYPASICYTNSSTPLPIVFADFVPILNNKPLDVNASSSFGTVYDARTGEQLTTRVVSEWSSDGMIGINFFAELPTHPAAVLVRFHIVGVDGRLVAETSALLPLGGSDPVTGEWGSIIMVVDPDMQLTSSALTAYVDGRQSPVTDGLLAFQGNHVRDVKISTSTLRNIVPDGNILIFVLNPSA